MANKTNSDSMSGQAALISGKYLEMRSAVFAYILKRTGSVEDSEDLMQETFTRLLEYRTVLTGHTLDRFIYRTAHNLVVDWYRRHALSEKAQEYFASRQKSADTTEEDIRLKEMMRTEQVCVRKMGRRKGAVSTNSSEPLVIIDGVAYESINDMRLLNPSDIESMSFLKDGAAAIYGSRAAGGVVLITTKKGKEGRAAGDGVRLCLYLDSKGRGEGPDTVRHLQGCGQGDGRECRDPCRDKSRACGKRCDSEIYGRYLVSGNG